VRRRTLERVLRVALFLVVGGCAGCYSCERVCTPRSQWDLERLADEGSVDCLVRIEDTPLTSLDGLERADSVFQLDVRDNVALSDYAGLADLRGMISLSGNGGTDALVTGPVGPSIAVFDDGFRTVDVALFDGASVLVGAEVLTTLTVRGAGVDENGDGEVVVDVGVGGAAAAFALDVQDASLRCAGLSRMDWLASIDDVPESFLSARHLALIDTIVQWRDDPREPYDALVARGFAGSLELCPQACRRADRDFEECAALCHVFGDVDDACPLVSR
jgi:hypothetical protein